MLFYQWMLSTHVFCEYGMYLLTAYPTHWGFDEKKVFRFFRYKIKGSYPKMATLFSWNFGQRRPSNYWFLGSKLTEETDQIISGPTHFWDFGSFDFTYFIPLYWWTLDYPSTKERASVSTLLTISVKVLQVFSWYTCSSY